MDYVPIEVTIRDRETDEEKSSGDRLSGFDEYWWTEGNGGCDCNRRLLFIDDDEDYPCWCKRYLIVAVNGNRDIDLAHWNQDYDL